jgi:hypothetical protein
LVVDGDEWSGSYPGKRCTPEERAYNIQRIRGSVDSRADLLGLAEEEIPVIVGNKI